MQKFINLLVGLTVGMGVMGGIESYRTMGWIYKECQHTAYDKGNAKLDVDILMDQAYKVSKELNVELNKCEVYN